MKLSLNQGAVEQKIVRGEKINESIYIGNYFNEYATIGRKEFSLKERQALKDGELIEIPKGSTRFENFILTEIQDSKKLIHYKRIRNFINSKNRKCIESSKYEKIKEIVREFISEICLDLYFLFSYMVIIGNI